MALQWVGTDLSGLSFHFWLSELCFIIEEPGMDVSGLFFKLMGCRFGLCEGTTWASLRLQQKSYSCLGIQFGLRCGFGAAPWEHVVVP